MKFYRGTIATLDTGMIITTALVAFLSIMGWIQIFSDDCESCKGCAYVAAPLFTITTFVVGWMTWMCRKR